MAKTQPKGIMIIAGPGAGKTYNMVESIIKALPELSPCRYMAVITYTNSATNNIQSRLSKKIIIPKNLFIGTMHSFLNRFIVIPFSAFMPEPVGAEKLFMQCCIDDVFVHVEKLKAADKRSTTPQAIASVKLNIKKKLNKLGYITFDQTLSIAHECISQDAICKIIANRLQYLFVDEFQDSGNQVYEMIESIRKKNKTRIYCVGDPEQYIQSFDSTIRKFSNIPILKAANSTGYTVQINDSNYRSTTNIVKFLNNFNGRTFGVNKFKQRALSKSSDSKIAAEIGANVYFINKSEVVKPVIDEFYEICEGLDIPVANRCILAKNKATIKRIISAMSQKYRDPKKTNAMLPIRTIQDTLLTTLHMNLAEFCEHYNATINTVRKYAIAIFKAIKDGTIVNENTYGTFVTNILNLKMTKGLPVKIENLKFDHHHREIAEVLTIANIHTIKGLEATAVLAIAKTEAELLLWIETDHTVRDAKRTNETTDYPRLGYVAFSRAERLLCIGCLEQITTATATKLQGLGVVVYVPATKTP